MTTILRLGDPRLRTPSTALAAVDPELVPTIRREAIDALVTFRARAGFGRALAAPQIGRHVRLVALDLGQGPFTIADPRITWRSEDTMTLWDDCMSFPQLLVKVRRHRSISLEHTDEAGQLCRWERLDASHSELLQHELDHLDGILAVDRAEPGNSLCSRAAYDAEPEAFEAEVDYSPTPIRGPLPAGFA